MRPGTPAGAGGPRHAGTDDRPARWRTDHAGGTRFCRRTGRRLQRREVLELSRRLQRDADGGRLRTAHVRLRGAALSRRNSPVSASVIAKAMPAVTVDNVLTLPRLPDLDGPASVDRPVLAITTAPKGVEGEGFPVRRAFYGLDQRFLDPFLHMDQMGEVEYGPGEPKGTAWHPHRGFETVTYMIDGTFQHQDSTR